MTNKETTNAGVLGDLQKLAVTLAANSADLPQLEIPRGKLGTTLTRAQELFHQQSAMRASKQAASQELNSLLIEGQRLANAMRGMVKEHYGIRSEKLAEFGLQPFRGRNRKVKTPTPTPEPPTGTPTPAPHPTPTTT
jgi:hypothetical protein